MKEMCTNHLQNKDDHKHDKESDPGPNWTWHMVGHKKQIKGQFNE